MDNFNQGEGGAGDANQTPPPSAARPTSAIAPQSLQRAASWDRCARCGTRPDARGRSGLQVNRRGQQAAGATRTRVRDDTRYLTRERINEAQASQDVEVARELRSLASRHRRSMRR